VQMKYEKMGSEHQKSVMGILNYYIETMTGAFPDAPLPESFFARMMENTHGYPAYVALNPETLEVVGFCRSMSPMPKNQAAHRRTKQP